MESSILYRSKIIIEAVTPFLSGETSVLDIGCGNGIVSNEIQKHFGCRFVGTDIMEYLERDIEFHLMKEEHTLPFDDNSFDYGVINDALHHVPLDDQIILIKEGLRVCSNILVFEVKPTFVAKMIDCVINQLYNSKMPMPLSHRSVSQWEKLFSINGIAFERHDVEKHSKLYPITNFLYNLSLTPGKKED